MQAEIRRFGLNHVPLRIHLIQFQSKKYKQKIHIPGLAALASHYHSYRITYINSWCFIIQFLNLTPFLILNLVLCPTRYALLREAEVFKL